MLPLASAAQSAAPSVAAPVEGSDYVVIANGQPWQPLKGQVEVVEIFAYSCSHCAALEPKLSAWKAKQRSDVRVTYVPAAYNHSDAFARGFFAAQSLGATQQTHAALFRAVHDAKSLPMRNPSIGEISTFYRQQGVDAAKFDAAINGPLVDAEMLRAREFVVASGLEGTPTLIVDGKYRVLGSSHDEALRIAEQLIAIERAARKTASATKRR